MFALQSEGSAQSDGDDRAATVAYYQSVRQSMAPLVQHLRVFPATLQGLASSDAAVSPALATSIATWEGDYATARDLVRRLTPPAQTTGAVEAARLYETGAMLYVEAARAASAAVSAAAPAPRKATAMQGERLYTLGDRMFDSAFRLLNAGSALSPSEFRFPPAVPGDVEAPRTPGPVAAAGPVPAPAPPDVWSRAHAADLARVAEMTRDASTTRTVFDDAQRQLAAPVSDPVAQEAVNGLRLAVLVLGESAEGDAENHRVPEQSERLTLIGTRLWNSALGLLGSASGFVDASLTLPGAASEDLLLQGGAFDGHPPTLNPGDPVDKGLPGGLPVLDPMALIGQ
ncbi:hypothetical protein [Sporichthya polymorpha]|uniref:hypothetical protein n=1 Tax=Sporichthya polymorpha TaxID=35751 RepID=UPI0012EC334D|nr:hypothetical protein [Sporichthya polymorpha]